MSSYPPRTRSGSSGINGSRRVAVLSPGPTEADTVIIISSDDSEDEESLRFLPKKRSLHRKLSKQQGKTKAKTPQPLRGDVIDVTSDDEEQKRRQSSRTVEEMEKQLDRLKQENQRLKREQVETSLKLHKVLRAEQDDGYKAKHKVLADALDDAFTCDICTCRMWIPATLTCGHTFCQTCLQDWFTTALMKHLNDHPTYTMHTARMRQIMQILQRENLQPTQRRALELDVLADFEKQAQPDYTCPSCRFRIRSRPVEVFALKAGVQIAADATGEKVPSQTSRSRKDGPWDGFFLNVDD